MKYKETHRKVVRLRKDIAKLRKEMVKLQKGVEPEAVEDYELTGADGPVRLSELMGDKGDLFVIHNMGGGCSYCTLWADGFNGVYPHLADRAAFVLSSPDAPAGQRKLAAARGWRFPMVSHRGTSFAADMGYASKDGGCLPGVSVFQRHDDGLVRVADTHFGPGDDFCSVWHFLDMLPAGPDGWGPRLKY